MNLHRVLIIKYVKNIFLFKKQNYLPLYFLYRHWAVFGVDRREGIQIFWEATIQRSRGPSRPCWFFQEIQMTWRQINGLENNNKKYQAYNLFWIVRIESKVLWLIGAKTGDATIIAFSYGSTNFCLIPCIIFQHWMLTKRDMVQKIMMSPGLDILISTARNVGFMTHKENQTHFLGC